MTKQIKSSQSGPSTSSEPLLEESANEDFRLFAQLPPARSVGSNRVDRPAASSTPPIQRSKEAKVRSRWAHLLLTVSFALTPVSLLDFPFSCFQHGGVTFLVPYLVVLMFVGTPLMIAEMAVGQFSGLPVVSLFAAINKTYAGLGKLMLVVTLWRVFASSALFVQSTYLAAIGVAAVFSGRVEWSRCIEGRSSSSCVNYDYFNATHLPAAVRLNDARPAVRLTPPFLDFLQTQIFPQPFLVSQLQPALSGVYVTSVFSWLLIGGMAAIGVRRVGGPVVAIKLVGFLLLFVCTATAFSTPGALAGVRFFFRFDCRHLIDGSAWADAAKHVLLSLSLADGTIHKLGGLGRFRSRFLRSVFGTLVVSFVFSLLGALLFFASLSALTKVLYPNSDVHRVLRMAEFAGHGRLITSAVFPELMSSTAPSVRSLLLPVFFLMIALITLPNAIIHRSKLVEAAEYSVWFSRLSARLPTCAKPGVVVFIALCILPVVLLLVHPWTQVAAALLDRLVVHFVFVGSLVENSVIAFAYDANRFNVDLITMHGHLPIWTTWTLNVCVWLVTPLLLSAGFVYNHAFNRVVRFGNYVVSSRLVNLNGAWALAIISLLLIFALIPIVQWVAHNYAVRAFFDLSPLWRPEQVEHAKAVDRARRTFGVEPNHLKTKIYDNHDPLDLLFRSGRSKAESSDDEAEESEKKRQ